MNFWRCDGTASGNFFVKSAQNRSDHNVSCENNLLFYLQFLWQHTFSRISKLVSKNSDEKAGNRISEPRAVKYQ